MHCWLLYLLLLDVLQLCLCAIRLLRCCSLFDRLLFLGPLLIGIVICRVRRDGWWSWLVRWLGLCFIVFIRFIGFTIILTLLFFVRQLVELRCWLCCLRKILPFWNITAIAVWDFCLPVGFNLRGRQKHSLELS